MSKLPVFFSQQERSGLPRQTDHSQYQVDPVVEERDL